jgi:hypothetical protein
VLPQAGRTHAFSLLLRRMQVRERWLLCSQRPTPLLLPSYDCCYSLQRRGPLGYFSGWINSLPHMWFLHQAEGLEGNHVSLNGVMVVSPIFGIGLGYVLCAIADAANMM